MMNTLRKWWTELFTLQGCFRHRGRLPRVFEFESAMEAMRKTGINNKAISSNLLNLCKRQSELALRKNVLANSIRRCFTDGTNKVTIRPEHILVPVVLTKCGRV